MPAPGELWLARWNGQPVRVVRVHEGFSSTLVDFEDLGHHGMSIDFPLDRFWHHYSPAPCPQDESAREQ